MSDDGMGQRMDRAESDVEMRPPTAREWKRRAHVLRDWAMEYASDQGFQRRRVEFSLEDSWRRDLGEEVLLVIDAMGEELKAERKARAIARLDAVEKRAAEMPSDRVAHAVRVLVHEIEILDGQRSIQGLSKDAVEVIAELIGNNKK